MEYYKKLVIKILERSMLGEDNDILAKLKAGHDLSQGDMRKLEELLDSII